MGLPQYQHFNVFFSKSWTHEAQAQAQQAQQAYNPFAQAEASWWCPAGMLVRISP